MVGVGVVKLIAAAADLHPHGDELAGQSVAGTFRHYAAGHFALKVGERGVDAARLGCARLVDSQQAVAVGVSARQFVRDQLDRLGLGQEITHIPWGSKRFRLPPSKVGEAGG